MRRRSDVSPSSSFLIAFKPRQVILLEKQQSNPPMAKSRPEIRTTQLKPENESILASSVALWLENKGFSKLLKRFLSAAQIEDDNWKSKALDLNEIFSKYQEICNSAHEDIKLQKNQEENVVGTTETNGDANCTAPVKITSKKKKKKSKDDTAINQTGKAPEGITKIESYVNGKEEEIHKTSDGPTHNGDQVLEVTVDQSAKKKEDKKKKKSKSMSQSSDADEKQTNVMSEVTKSKDEVLSSKSSAKELLDGETKLDKKSEKISAEAAENGVRESKKASKKRKRIATDENENQSAQEVVVEESKAKKSKGLNGHADKQNKEENTKDADEVDNSGEQKSARKKHNSSAEPKTQNAFQRVKVEEVKFADERLQDNSYWAKDGAEIGYGAKAQEVLGQVKGRDFRHEKTKKKRGSYRGGQIDLHSHSIKFNYSDEE